LTFSGVRAAMICKATCGTLKPTGDFLSDERGEIRRSFIESHNYMTFLNKSNGVS
jgi:hypothetical protein